MSIVNGLDHVGLRVRDFQTAIAFYKQFGFEVIREDLQERVVVLQHDSGVLLNMLDSAMMFYRARNILMDNPIKHTGYTHLAFRVEDIEQAIQHIKRLGIEITEGPVTFGDGKTSIFIRDQDRNVIEFTQLSREVDSRSDIPNGLNREVAE